MTLTRYARHALRRIRVVRRGNVWWIHDRSVLSGAPSTEEVTGSVGNSVFVREVGNPVSGGAALVQVVSACGRHALALVPESAQLFGAIAAHLEASPVVQLRDDIPLCDRSKRLHAVEIHDGVSMNSYEAFGVESRFEA